MNCSVYTPSFLSYKNSHSHQLSSFRIDDILKTPTSSSSSSSSSSISPTFIDPTTLWSSFASQILAYSPELLSISTTTTSPSNDISQTIPNLISPQKHLHHRHQYHPYLSVSRHSPTTKLQHDTTNKNNYQHTLSPLSIKDKIQHQHIDRNDCLSSMIPPPPSSHHHQVQPPTAAYWPYLYTRCNPSLTTTTTTNVSRRKGGQIRFSAEQSLQLEKKFEISQYLSPVERKQIAKTLHLSERQIKTWFQNRRAKHRRSAATVTKKDIDKSCSSPQQSDEEDDDDDIDVEDNVDEEHATSSNSN
ncbi:unnamed protein product [Rotaria sp. Silwood1]|nr:unnamed protein product [Rotaria sp. Silwood1]CAF1054560.1 unnamed protein product [Rotaria sp. Silwood1]CAF1260512.1 unnamed protein product [Rotaria sp. Silwood1]CAF3423452.1 unnamed protein product [Rotaria sp. Silwood1]CAF3431175.1 unnamed protein product [Rotaria sp. Silwood1]